MNATDLALMLKDWRATHGLTQREASAALDLDVNHLEKAESLPRPLALADLLHRLTLPVDITAAKGAAGTLPLISADALAQQLRAWRGRHRLAQHQAARLLGIDVRTVVAWENRTQFPQRPLLVRALAVLAAPPAREVGIHGWHARTRAHRDPRCTFGKKLRAWRKGRGLNQLAACIALGLPHDQALISHLERGKALPKPARLAAILAQIGGAL